jgi:hypothetical protein
MRHIQPTLCSNRLFPLHTRLRDPHKRPSRDLRCTQRLSHIVSIHLQKIDQTNLTSNSKIFGVFVRYVAGRLTEEIYASKDESLWSALYQLTAKGRSQSTYLGPCSAKIADGVQKLKYVESASTVGLLAPRAYCHIRSSDQRICNLRVKGSDSYELHRTGNKSVDVQYFLWKSAHLAKLASNVTATIPEK